MYELVKSNEIKSLTKMSNSSNTCSKSNSYSYTFFTISTLLKGEKKAICTNFMFFARKKKFIFIFLSSPFNLL